MATTKRNAVKPIEVRPLKGKQPGWEIAHQGGAVVSTHRTQREAIAAARPIARREQGEFVLKGRNGRVRDRSSYGNDPHGRG